MRCDFCPRYCRVDRAGGERGYCRAGALPSVSLVDLHHWEEPSISGDRGSGAVFFAGCNLRCVFCQNHAISQGSADAKEMSIDELVGEFQSLLDRGAHNINLISPTHFVGPVAKAIREARHQGFPLPFVYNTNGYESEEGMAALDGLVDVYLPDLKYVSGNLSGRYSGAPDYFKHASIAIMEMARQVGPPQIDSDGLIKRGLIVRHLVLPGHVDDSIACLRWIHDNLPEDTYVSVMSQYYPCHRAHLFPEINRTLNQSEYDRVLEEVYFLGIEGYMQNLSSASPAYTPDFERSRE